MSVRSLQGPCEVCRGLGWVIDGTPSFVLLRLYFIECPDEDCLHSGRALQSLNVLDARFTLASREGELLSLLSGQRAGQ